MRNCLAFLIKGALKMPIGFLRVFEHCHEVDSDMRFLHIPIQPEQNESETSFSLLERLSGQIPLI